MQLKRCHTMKRASEFAMVRTQGSSRAGRFLIFSTLTYPQENGAERSSRFGIITTKRLGHAVVRNLLRRRIREILRAHGAPLSHGRYVVIIPRHTAATATYGELEQDFLRLLKRAHILPATPPC